MMWTLRPPPGIYINAPKPKKGKKPPPISSPKPNPKPPPAASPKPNPKPPPAASPKPAASLSKSAPTASKPEPSSSEPSSSHPSEASDAKTAASPKAKKAHLVPTAGVGGWVTTAGPQSSNPTPATSAPAAAPLAGSRGGDGGDCGGGGGDGDGGDGGGGAAAAAISGGAAADAVSEGAGSYCAGWRGEPPQTALQFALGTKRKGLDGEMWEVDLTAVGQVWVPAVMSAKSPRKRQRNSQQ